MKLKIISLSLEEVGEFLDKDISNLSNTELISVYSFLVNDHLVKSDPLTKLEDEISDRDIKLSMIQ